jgi:uncharacterized protein YchJ
MSKVGRNDLCLCNSGIKYKRCCLIKIAKKRAEPPPVRRRRTSKRNAALLAAMFGIAAVSESKGRDINSKK